METLVRKTAGNIGLLPWHDGLGGLPGQFKPAQPISLNSYLDFWPRQQAVVVSSHKTDMPRLSNFTLIFSVVLSSTTHSQNFDALTSKIFFSVDIKKHDTTSLSDINARPELTLERDTGWTVYPPTDNKGNLIPFYRFSFSKHPYFLSDLNSGGIIIMLSKNSDKIIGMSMSFSIISAQTCDSIYRSLTKSYTKYASKTIKRPNIGQPFEVTKYLSEDGIDYVIITKGESDKRPYIHIAYNYQGYDW